MKASQFGLLLFWVANLCLAVAFASWWLLALGLVAALGQLIILSFL
jgi:hypothetical protein